MKRKRFSTQGLLKFARYGVNYGMDLHNLAARMSFLAYPHRVTHRNMLRLQEEILAQGTFGGYFRFGVGPVKRIRPTRKI